MSEPCLAGIANTPTYDAWSAVSVLPGPHLSMAMLLRAFERVRQAERGPDRLEFPRRVRGTSQAARRRRTITVNDARVALADGVNHVIVLYLCARGTPLPDAIRTATTAAHIVEIGWSGR
jgi:hypothetical protein